jgi:hypothetical protein
MMRKLVEETRLKSFQGNRAVGNPDACAIKVHLVGGGGACLFLRCGSRKQRPVKHRQLGLPGGIRNRSGEWAGILVVNVAEIQAFKRSKRDKAEPLPVKEIRRACRGPHFPQSSWNYAARNCQVMRRSSSRMGASLMLA